MFCDAVFSGACWSSAMTAGDQWLRDKREAKRDANAAAKLVSPKAMRKRVCVRASSRGKELSQNFLRIYVVLIESIFFLRVTLLASILNRRGEPEFFRDICAQDHPRGCHRPLPLGN
jgi:hypothetical protein